MGGAAPLDDLGGIISREAMIKLFQHLINSPERVRGPGVFIKSTEQEEEGILQQEAATTRETT